MEISMNADVKEEPIDQVDDFEASWNNYGNEELKESEAFESEEQVKTEENEEEEVQLPLAIFLKSYDDDEEEEKEEKEEERNFEEIGPFASVDIKEENESFQGASRAALEGSPSLCPAMPPLCRIIPAAEKSNQEEQGAKKIYKCSECAFETAYLYSFKVHFRVHGGEKPFWCRVCNYSTGQSTHVNTHICHSIKAYMCSQCGFKALTKGSLGHHLRKQHSEESILKCSHCDFTAAAKEHLKRHQSAHKVYRKGKAHTCSHCGFVASTETSLKEHEHKHKWVAKKPYKCLQCDFSAFTQYSLKEHTLLHRGLKPHKCSQCEFRSATQTSLKTHERMHEREKGYLYKCSKCDFGASERKQLTEHRQVHRGANHMSITHPYKCPYCEFAGTRSTFLEIHLRKCISREKPFRCRKCNKRFSNRGSLSEHSLSHM